MFEIKETGVPEECANCESCGYHGNDVKSILVYQAVKRNGKMARISGRIAELRLCRKCRMEMSDILSKQ